jgi:hypothetical protein
MTNQERERIEALIDELENVDRAYASPYTTRLMMKKAAAQLRADHPARGERDETDMPWPLKLAALRKAGWVVAVHNDYRQGGMPMTFWLFTHSDGRWVKGEGATDHLALVAVFRRLGLMQMPPPVAQTQTEATPADPSQCARNPCVVAGPSLVVQAEQRVNFAAGNAAADDHGCTKESVRAAAAIIASSLPSIAALDRARGAGSVSDAEAAAFRRGVEAMRKAARAEMNRLYFAEAEPTQQAYDRQDAFHCADRAIAAMPPPEDTP